MNTFRHTPPIPPPHCRYIPVIEDLNIEVDARRIALESEAGPFQFLIKVWGCGKDEGGGTVPAPEWVKRGACIAACRG